MDLLHEPELRSLPLGYFGASSGSAAALAAAASAAKLLIVGGDDWNVLELNDEAASLLRCPHELAVVPHAGHLFEEPGALERVTELAADWFTTHLAHAAGRHAA